MNIKADTAISYTILLITLIFIVINLSFMDEIFLLTTPFGSDMGTHYYALLYFKNELLPNFNLLSWDQSSHGGYPIFQYYHPLPFIITALISYIIPIQIAFKLTILFSIFALPVSLFFACKILTKNSILSGLASVTSLLSLYHKEHEIYGGNLSSVFAGEFCFSIANSILLIYLALLVRGHQENKFIALNGLILAILPLTHLVTFTVALFSATFFLFLRPFKYSFQYLFKIHLLGFLLSAFWTVPMFLKRGFTSELINTADWWHNAVKIFHLFPRTLIACYITILLYFTYQLFSKQKIKTELLLFFFAMLVSSIFYIHNIIGWPSRFHPVMGIIAGLLATLIIGEVTKSKKILLIHVSYIMIIIGVAIVPSKTYNTVKAYAQYVFKGMEATPGYEDFMALHTYFDKRVGNFRVVAQKGKERSKAVTDRSFEYTPYISKAITMEGLYGAGSIGYIFEKTMNGKFIREPIPSETLYQQFLEYNIGWIIAVKDRTKTALKSSPDYSLVHTRSIYDVFKLNRNQDSYVFVSKSPVYNLDQSLDDWKSSASDWFKAIDQKRFYFTYNAPNKNQNISSIEEKGNLPLFQTENNCIQSEEIKSQSFTFKTNCPGKPHIIKISYFPDWQVEGAKKIHLVSPGFMLVYPEGNSVKLFYGRTTINIVSNYLSYAGLILLLIFIFKIPKTLPSETKLYAGKILIFTSIFYIFIYTPETYYKFRYYPLDFLNSQSSAKLLKQENYLEAEEKALKIKSKYFLQEKNYLLAKLNYFNENYREMTQNVYYYVQNGSDNEKKAEIRYYFALSKEKQKLYKHYMHEAFQLNTEHKISPWNQKFQETFRKWKKENPRIFEIHKDDYK